MNNRKIIAKTVFMFTALILVFVIVYSGLQILESTVFFKDQTDRNEELTQPAQTKSVYRDGVRYFPRQDIMVMMILGVDREGKAQAGVPNQSGAADMITLMVFDEKTQECTLLCLNRDTMVYMPKLNEYGKEVGTRYGQLALSHSYGTGLEDSCENTRKTVSALLNGVEIDHYYAMNMDAISMLNDAVGGVTVTVNDDFSEVDPSLQKGRMKLDGRQAVLFVQSRRNVGNQLNLSRMDRQKEYMRGFVSALQAKLDQGAGATLELYEGVSEYIVTDCSAAVMSRLMEDYGDYTLGQVISLPGSNVLGEKYYEFHLDQEAVEELVLELFYAPVQ